MVEQKPMEPRIAVLIGAHNLPGGIDALRLRLDGAWDIDRGERLSRSGGGSDREREQERQQMDNATNYAERVSRHGELLYTKCFAPTSGRGSV